MVTHNIPGNNPKPDQAPSKEEYSGYSWKAVLVTLASFILMAYCKYPWAICIGTLGAFGGFFAPFYENWVGGQIKKLIRKFRQQRSRSLHIVSAPPQGAGHLQRTQPRPAFITSTPQDIAPSFPTAPSPSFSRISRSKSHLAPLDPRSQRDKEIAEFGDSRLIRR
jgi:hypothetical protein